MAWLVALLIVVSVVLVLRLVALWLVLPWYLPATYGLLAIPAAAYSFRGAGARSLWPTGARGWIGAVVRAAVVALGAATVVYAWAGRRVPEAAVDVAFPMREGTYLVANGGRIPLINAHLKTLTGDRFRAYRGQSHGVDLVRVDGWGRRANGLQPRDPRAYRIFGDSVFAPCAGRVLQIERGLPDQPVPEVDRAHMAGNHVLLECTAAWVLLGHLQRESVLVSAGESVAVGTPIGRVGNSGNTSEPHLHIHAQRPGTTAMPFGGSPLPIRLGGWYPVRNARTGGHR